MTVYTITHYGSYIMASYALVGMVMTVLAIIPIRQLRRYQRLRRGPHEQA